MSNLARDLFIVALFLCSALHGGAFQQSEVSRSASAKGPATTGDQSKAPDHSNESFVVEQLTNNVIFAADGTAQEERAARIRIQSAAAIQQFGVLVFPYRSAFERLDVIGVNVTKVDGNIINTPESDVHDVPTDMTREAPTYSDSREKQVPVKGLGIGDVLEWHTRTTRATPDVSGQFWYSYDFFKAGIVLEETLRVSVPQGKYVKVSSPSITPDVREENSQRIYTWKTSQREHVSEESQKPKSRLQPHPAVQFTTFKRWEEVGQWYGELQKARLNISPAVNAKSAELTSGLGTNADKQRAIYQFVSTQFRYISVSFGQGRYQPHSADEVLANQYGDCKDKHTLFSALLSAAGIEAWPVLIGAGYDLDPEVPSPAQFNHLITYIPGGQSPVWLDTTSGVMPFGMLDVALRDQKALVIPVNGVPSLMTTPEAPPFPADSTVNVKSKIDADGTLTGHFEVSVRGDGEVILRSAFQATAPMQWTQLAQNLALLMGYGGTVSSVSVDNPTKTDVPFHYSYDYERKSYPEWGNQRITPPLPPLSLDAGDEQPTEPLFLGAPGKITHRATVELPEGYSATLPANSELHSDFADFKMSYALEKNTLVAERVLTLKKTKVAVSDWEKYRKFADAATTDGNQYIQLELPGSTTTTRRANPPVGETVQKAALALQNRDFDQAQDALAEAEQSDPKQPGLWAAYGMLYEMQSQPDKAIEAYQREIEYHPDNEWMYQGLAAVQRRTGRRDDEIQTRLKWVKVAPENVDAAVDLAILLNAVKRYGETIQVVDGALKNHGGEVRLQMQLLQALLRDGKTAEGSAVLADLRERNLDFDSRNKLAYILADTNTEASFAQELATKIVVELEDQSKTVSLSTLTNSNLRSVVTLGVAWDTLGWAYFRTGDLAKAERFLQAGWELLQDPASADHLGQLYEQQGKKDDAIHAYRLALAVKRDLTETQERLEKLGVSADDRPRLIRRTESRTAPPTSPENELSRMRSVAVPGLSQRDGTAELFVLISAKGIENASFIKGDEKLKAAVSVLPKITYKVSFPDNGPEKIVRRGFLSCSEYTTPNCNFVLLLPADTQM